MEPSRPVREFRLDFNLGLAEHAAATVDIMREAAKPIKTHGSIPKPSPGAA